MRKFDLVLLNNFNTQDEILLRTRSLILKSQSIKLTREMLKTNSKKLNQDRNYNLSGILAYPFIVRDAVQ